MKTVIIIRVDSLPYLFYSANSLLNTFLLIVENGWLFSFGVYIQYFLTQIL